ncbi:MAG: hypothetical protein CMJ46_12775 [Planctomyces sp.]|nr:hypothetical protein [Planctomyces sp.]
MTPKKMLAWGLAVTLSGFNLTSSATSLDAYDGPELASSETRVEVITPSNLQPVSGEYYDTRDDDGSPLTPIPPAPRRNRPSFPLYRKHAGHSYNNGVPGEGERTAMKQPLGPPVPPPMVAPPMSVESYPPEVVYPPSYVHGPVPQSPLYPPAGMAMGCCDHCGASGWCSAEREYSLCHDCSLEHNICVENFHRRHPGRTCLDRWFCDPWLRAYTIQPAGCCESKTWYKFE